MLMHYTIMIKKIIKIKIHTGYATRDTDIDCLTSTHPSLTKQTLLHTNAQMFKIAAGYILLEK